MGGFVALLAGAEFLVGGASSLAVRTGLSPLVVGLTVVAFGTAAPELAVSIRSTWQGQSGIAVGNVIGSNITNILMVLGLSAALGGAIHVARQIVRTDVPIMILATLVVFVMSLNGYLGRLEGAALFSGIVVYVIWTVRRARSESISDPEPPDGIQVVSLPREIAQIVGGVVALAIGATWLVDSASEIANSLGVSDLVVALTVVAFGTSAPELATSLVAARKGKGDLAVGTVIGSNIFNLLAVLGLTAFLAPDVLAIPDDALRLDMPVMLAVSLACLPIFFNGFIIRRWEGAVFFAFYVAYLTFIVLDATGSGLTHPFGVVMGVFVLPMTGLTLLAIGLKSIRQSNLRKASSDRPGSG